MGYREDGLKTYGEKCEICSYNMGEVHHIDYQEHQQVEDYIRYLDKNGNDISEELEEAKAKGYLLWDKKAKQLAKDDRTANLSVLCSNCHSLVHKMDVGKKLLKVIPSRK